MFNNLLIEQKQCKKEEQHQGSFDYAHTHQPRSHHQNSRSTRFVHAFRLRTAQREVKVQEREGQLQHVDAFIDRQFRLAFIYIVPFDLPIVEILVMYSLQRPIVEILFICTFLGDIYSLQRPIVEILVIYSLQRLIIDAHGSRGWNNWWWETQAHGFTIEIGDRELAVHDWPSLVGLVDRKTSCRLVGIKPTRLGRISRFG